MTNSPFSQKFGHDLTFDDVNSLFVANQELMDKFNKNNNTFVWGFRGTGKTMLLRYFDMEVQCKKSGSFRQYLEDCDFIGIHLNFVCGAFDIPNLDIENQAATSVQLGQLVYSPDILYDRMAYAMSEHLIISAILDSFMKKIADCLEDSHYEFSRVKELSAQISKIIKTTPGKTAKNSVEIFKNLGNSFALERQKMIEVLCNFYMGDRYAFHSLRDYMTFDMTFKPIVRLFQRFIGRNIPIYLLLDDVSNLHTFQQKQLNTWIEQREYDLVCFKIASEPFEYRAFGTLSATRRILQKDYDYDEIILDFDTGFKNINERREVYTDVANRRIERYIVSKGHTYNKEIHSIETLLQASCKQEESTCKYAGMEDIAILCFGNIREFLWLCDGIFENNFFDNEAIEPIAVKEQHRLILEHSNAFALRFLSGDENADIDKKLNTLLKSLMELMKYRFYSKDFNGKYFDAFTVKEQHKLKHDAKNVLRRGIFRQFFRKTFFTTEGGARQDIFIINKMLFPKYGLDICETGSRLELSCEVFTLALTEESFLVGKLREDSGDTLTLKDIAADSERSEYEFGRLY